MTKATRYRKQEVAYNKGFARGLHGMDFDPEGDKIYKHNYLKLCWQMGYIHGVRETSLLRGWPSIFE